jgi:hypothetical protein
VRYNLNIVLTSLLDRRLLAAVLPIAFALVPSAALGGYREDLHVTSIEMARLPQFCWMQFEVPDAKGDDFRIQDCGVAANHYCPGLLYLMRAKGPAAKGRPLPLLQHADIDVAYTERAIADSPKCSIREHVDATRAEINHLLLIYGGKRSNAK